MEFLENRKSPEKWTFLSLAFYNAPSLHTVNILRITLRLCKCLAEKESCVPVFTLPLLLPLPFFFQFVLPFVTAKTSRNLICHDCQGQVSAEGILHLVNPNLGSNSGMRIFEPRILGPNSGVEFFGPVFSNKKSPLKNSPSRNSPPKIHIKKFTQNSG